MKIIKQSKEKGKHIGLMLFSIISVLLIWEVFVSKSDISPIVLVGPSAIFPVILQNSDILQRELLYTMNEVFFGWLIGNLFAILLSTLIFSFRYLSKLVISIGVLINAVPLIALAAILGGFIGTDQFAKTVIVAILCFFPMLIVTTSAFSSVNGDYRSLFNTYNSSQFKTFIKLVLPHSLPAIFTTLKINVINAMSTAIVSEFFGAHGGIGQFILSRKGFYDLPMVWAAIFFIIIAGSAFYFAVGILKSFFINWD